MTTTKSGNRQRLPKNPLRVCASCLAPRGNVRKDWQPITSAEGRVLGYTCPQCPRWDEHIRRVSSAAGVRLRAVVDLTPPGARKRVQRTRTLPTLTEAREWVAKAPHGRPHGEQTSETVAGLCERWLSSRVDVREVIREGYGFALQSVLRLIGHRSRTRSPRPTCSGSSLTCRRTAANRPGNTRRGGRSARGPSRSR